MKAKEWDTIVTVEDVTIEDIVAGAAHRRTIPRGTEGVVIEAYSEPAEGYAIDVRIPNERALGGYDFDHVLLEPHQFDVTNSSSPKSPTTSTDHRVNRRNKS